MKPELARGPEDTQEDRARIARWCAGLDELSYYSLLGLSEDAPAPAVTEAFRRFTETFHPDAHATLPADALDDLSRIFARGAEAYRVLSNARERKAYDEALAEGGPPRRFSSMRPEAPRLLEDSVVPSARAFAQKARELAERGDLGSAKLHAELALVHDGTSEELRSFHRWLVAQLLEARLAGH